MSTYISDSLSQLNVVIDQEEIKAIETFVISFEVANSIALNTPLLGVERAYFTEANRAHFFEIFGVTEREVFNVIKTIPSIDTSYKVSSDAFNVMAVWVMHLAYRDIPTKEKRDAFTFNIAKILHYKFFTSLVIYNFPHKANEKIMTYVVNNLTKKFDLIQYGTWKLTIEARCKDLIDEEDSIHHKAFSSASSDKDFLYIITDSQSRMRDKIKNIVQLYYDAKSKGLSIQDRSSTSEDAEGEKTVISSTSTFDVIISNLNAEILSVNLFLNRDLVNNIAAQFSNISPDMLRGCIVSISQLATTQSSSGELDKVINSKEGEIYVGMRAFITNLIQKSFRYTLKKHIDFNNKAEIYIHIKNVYSSSRINDPDILAVKRSLSYLVDGLGKSKRETTKSSLRLAILLYLITKSFSYI